MKHITRCLTQLMMAAALLLAMGCGGKEDSGSIAGLVVDANSGEPVRAANITLNPTGGSAVSGADGRYEFHDLPEGTYTVQAAKTGYITNTKTVVVKSGTIGSGDILLTPSSADMTLSVSQIDFGSNQNVEMFRIINNAANGTIQWSIVKESSADWLTVSPTNGSCGAGQQSQVTLTVDRSLVTTSQTVNLRVTNNTSGNSIALPVSVTYNSGTLQVTPNPIDFGSSSTSQQMTLYNSGSTIVNYEVSYSCAWLTVSPTSGTLSSNSSATVLLTLDRTMITGTAQTILQVRNMSDGSLINVTVTASNNGGGGGGGGGEGGTIVVPGGLQCYYTFEGDNSNDVTDNGADAIMMNSASIATDGSRKYLKLNSLTDDYLQIPYNFFHGLTDWSVSFWIKDFGAGNIFAAQNSSTNPYNYYDAPLLWAMQDNTLRIKCNNGGMPQSNGYGGTSFNYNYTTIQADGSWHHIVVTMNGGGTEAKLYVDGQLKDNINCSYQQYIIDDCSRVVFGGSKNGLYAFSSSMKFDNIRIYNRTLTNAEVQTIRNNEM